MSFSNSINNINANVILIRKKYTEKIIFEDEGKQKEIGEIIDNTITTIYQSDRSNKTIDKNLFSNNKNNTFLKERNETDNSKSSLFIIIRKNFMHRFK